MSTRSKGVRQFPAEYLDVWKLASSEQGIKLTFDSHGKATNMRQRLNTYRKRLMDEAPEVAAPFMLTDLDITQLDENTWAIVNYVPEWKRQLRAQIAAGEPEIVTPITQDPSNGKLDVALEKLGFTSK